MLGVFVTGPAAAQTAEKRLEAVIQKTEGALDARVGMVVYDAASDWSYRHRAAERTLTNSTFKVLLCGAILKQVDAGQMALAERVEVTQADLLHYAPVTKTRVGQSMSLAELCSATLDHSDNTAANLLIDRLGEPSDITRFLRGIGDETTRVDRREPGMNIPGPTGNEDTSTPIAMAHTLQKLLVGEALSPAARETLVGWMSKGSVTGQFLRATAPSGWQIADKSGGGLDTRSIIAMISPQPGRTYFVAIYLSDAKVPMKTRNAALAEICAAVVEVLKTR